MPSTSSLMITGPPRTTPVVVSLCACAATGAVIAAATAAIASILFRMGCSLIQAGFTSRRGTWLPMHRVEDRSPKCPVACAAISSFFAGVGTCRCLKRLPFRTPRVRTPSRLLLCPSHDPSGRNPRACFSENRCPPYPDHALGCRPRIEIPINRTRGAFPDDPVRRPHLTDPVAYRGSVDSDHASALEPDRRDIPYSQRPDRPRIVEVAPFVVPRIQRRTACADPFKVV